MTERVGESVAGDLSPEAAFALLGNETRIAIIRAIWESPEHEATFSELRDQVGMSDSGQFNYHLGKLVETFVRRENGKYELTHAGWRIIGAILAGTYTKRTSVDPFEIDATCPACGSVLELHYDGDHLVVRCPVCDDLHSKIGFPPGGLEHRRSEELPRTLERWTRAHFSLIRDGICLNCAGTMIRSIISDSDQILGEVGVEYVCEQCGDRAYSSIGSHVLYHPAVITFHYDHGIDVTADSMWGSAWLNDEYTTIRSEDPWEIEVAIPLDDEELGLVVDENVDVIEEHHRNIEP